jgi:hypothetical protein
MNLPTVDVFADESGDIGLVLRECSITEWDGDELAPALMLDVWGARCLAAALIELADQIENNDD